MREVTVNPADFLAASGTITLAQWSDLTPDERAAMVAAGNERQARLADMISERVLAGIDAIAADSELSRLVDHAEEVVG